MFLSWQKTKNGLKLLNKLKLHCYMKVTNKSLAYITIKLWLFVFSRDLSNVSQQQRERIFTQQNKNWSIFKTFIQYCYQIMWSHMNKYQAELNLNLQKQKIQKEWRKGLNTLTYKLFEVIDLTMILNRIIFFKRINMIQIYMIIMCFLLNYLIKKLNWQKYVFNSGFRAAALFRSTSLIGN